MIEKSYYRPCGENVFREEKEFVIDSNLSVLGITGLDNNGRKLKHDMVRLSSPYNAIIDLKPSQVSSLVEALQALNPSDITQNNILKDLKDILDKYNG